MATAQHANASRIFESLVRRQGSGSGSYFFIIIIPYTLGGYDQVIYMIYMSLAVSGVIRPVVYLANS
eukprot:scaffold42096_cov150-Skeletonema_dohrnii-CCMP3373.AAC.3